MYTCIIQKKILKYSNLTILILKNNISQIFNDNKKFNKNHLNIQKNLLNLLIKKLI